MPHSLQLHLQRFPAAQRIILWNLHVQTLDHSHSGYSCYKFPQESEEHFPGCFSMVIRLLAPNDIMNIQLTIVSAQCFMHDILRTVQNTTLKF